MDAARQKLSTFEQRVKGTETNLELSYKAKLQAMEEKNRALTERLSGERAMSDHL